MAMRITQNPNKEYADEIKRKLKDNSGYCPCRLQKTEDTKCMCKEFKDKLNRKESGYCHCELYYADFEE